MMITAKIKLFQPNGYQETIEKRLSAIHSFNSGMSLGKDDDIEQLLRQIKDDRTKEILLAQINARIPLPYCRICNPVKKRLVPVLF